MPDVRRDWGSACVGGDEVIPEDRATALLEKWRKHHDEMNRAENNEGARSVTAWARAAAVRDCADELERELLPLLTEHATALRTLREERDALLAHDEFAWAKKAYNFWRESMLDLVEDRDAKKHENRKLKERAEALETEARTLREERDRLKAVAVVTNHNCELWRDEGLGCRECNPIAREIGPFTTIEEALRERAEAAEAALRIYGQHLVTCELRTALPGTTRQLSCTCDFAAVLQPRRSFEP
jgi:hypothetical protein